jgi:hypothetical protein
MVWTWTLRLVLPMLLAILGAAIYVIWAEAPYAPGLLDVLGTLGLLVSMLGIVLWCLSDWLSEEADPIGGDTVTSKS